MKTITKESVAADVERIKIQGRPAAAKLLEAIMADYFRLKGSPNCSKQESALLAAAERYIQAMDTASFQNN